MIYAPGPKLSAHISNKAQQEIDRYLVILVMLVIRVNFCVCSVEKKFCKKTVFSGIELICELTFAKPCLIITQNLFLIVSYCSCSFGEFAKVFESQV